MNRPNPKDYKNPSTSPTHILNEAFELHEIHHTEYEGTPQLLCVITTLDTKQKYDCYVSNSTVTRFLLQVNREELLPAQFIFYKSQPTQRYYEIAWADEYDVKSDMPF